MGKASLRVPGWNILALSALIVFFPPFAGAQEQGNEVDCRIGVYHTVQKGDTLWDISTHYNDTPWQWPDLWQENRQIANPHWIYPGERIRLLNKKGTGTRPLRSARKAAKRIYHYSLIDSIGFIRKVPVQPRGTIFKVKDDKRMISEGDLVYIKGAETAELLPGNRFTIYRTVTPMTGKRSGAAFGTQYYITGVLKITQKAPEFAVAEIVKSFREIKINDCLMPYMKRSPEITLIDSQPGCFGSVIASEEGSSIIGDNAVAFIDKGVQDGIQPGQVYSIYHQEKQKIDSKSDQDILLNPVNFGKLLILHAEATTSTVLVTQANQDLHPGSKICTPSK